MSAIPSPEAMQAAATPVARAAPPPFGFIVTRWNYLIHSEHSFAVEARERLAARSRRPKKLVVMKQLLVNGAPAYFVTNYKYRQARNLTIARAFFDLPDRPRETPKTSRAIKRLKHKRPEDRRIRCVINVSGPLKPDIIAAAQEFFAREISEQSNITQQQMEALHGRT